MTTDNKNYNKNYNPIPAYERTFVSSQFLAKNPQYQSLFKRCPNCSMFALKPIGYKKMNPSQIKEKDEKLERQCGVCGYIHRSLFL